MKYARLLLILLGLLGMATDAIAHMGRGGHSAAGGQTMGGAHFRNGGQFHGERHFGSFHHHRGAAVIILGAPLAWSWYDPAPYYGPPAYVYDDPPVYIEQGSSNATRYYCDDPKGYYPEVIYCPGGWRPVSSAPPP